MSTKKETTIQEKLIKIQTELHVKKGRRNNFGNYNFRSAEDILEAIKPFEKSLNVYVVVNEELISTDNSLPIIQSTATITDGEHKASISATSIVGVDLNQKGMQKAQQFGAASSYAKKYALGNLFLIDDTADADATNTHGSAPKKATTTAKSELPTMTKEKFEEAKDYVKKGIPVSKIEKKYSMTTAQKSSLEKIAKDNG